MSIPLKVDHREQWITEAFNSAMHAKWWISELDNPDKPVQINPQAIDDLADRLLDALEEIRRLEGRDIEPALEDVRVKEHQISKQKQREVKNNGQR